MMLGGGTSREGQRLGSFSFISELLLAPIEVALVGLLLDTERIHDPKEQLIDTSKYLFWS